MNIEDTCKTLIQSRLFDVLRAQKSNCLKEAEKMGIDSVPLVFTTHITPDILSSSCIIYTYNIEDKEDLAERMLDHPSAELDYWGKDIENTFKEVAKFDGIKIQTEITISLPLPLEYLGVLVQLGRLEITQSSVHCST